MEKLEKLNQKLNSSKDISSFGINEKTGNIEFSLFNGIDSDIDELEFVGSSRFFIDKIDTDIDPDDLTPYGLFACSINKKSGEKLIELVKNIYKYGNHLNKGKLFGENIEKKYKNDYRFFIELKGSIEGYVICREIKYKFYDNFTEKKIHLK